MSQGKEKGVLGFLGDVLMLCVGCVGMLILAVVLLKGASQETVTLLVVVVLVICMVGVILVTRDFIKEHDGWRKLGPYVLWLLVQVPFSLAVVLPVVVPLLKSGERPEDVWAKGGMAFGASVALRYVVIGLLRGVVGFFRWVGVSGRGLMVHGLFLLLAGMGAWTITAFTESALLAKGIERSTKVEEKLIGLFLGSLGVLYLFFLFAVRVVKPVVHDTSETLIMDLRVGRGWFFGGDGVGSIYSGAVWLQGVSREKDECVGTVVVLAVFPWCDGVGVLETAAAKSLSGLEGDFGGKEADGVDPRVVFLCGGGAFAVVAGVVSGIVSGAWAVDGSDGGAVGGGADGVCGGMCGVGDGGVVDAFCVRERGDGGVFDLVFSCASDG